MPFFIVVKLNESIKKAILRTLATTHCARVRTLFALLHALILTKQVHYKHACTLLHQNTFYDL